MSNTLKSTVVLVATAALFSTAALGDEPDYSGDVTDVRTIRRVEQHPQAWRVWQPFIIRGDKKSQLIVAFGAMRNGKKDMGDILITLSKDDGATWEEPIVVFDHTQKNGAIQFAYANPVLYRAPGQAVIWCFAMRLVREVARGGANPRASGPLMRRGCKR